MNAASRFLPSAISPRSVHGPSASTWPCSTRSPSSTMGFWLKEVPWLERLNLDTRYVVLVPSSFEALRRHVRAPGRPAATAGVGNEHVDPPLLRRYGLVEEVQVG